MLIRGVNGKGTCNYLVRIKRKQPIERIDLRNQGGLQ
jgi:hypothetical protein